MSWRRPLAALCAGAALPLAFAPFSLWPVAFASPALLFGLLAGRERRRAAFAGWCFGLGLFGCGVWWIQVSVHQFGVPYYAFSVTVTAVFVAGMALYPALFGWLFATLRIGAQPARLALGAPAIWVLLELLRAWLLTGFPWLALGYSQVSAPFGAFAPVAGVYGCSLAVAVVGGLLAAGWSGTWRVRAWALAVVALLFSTAFALRGTAWTFAAGPPLDVALIQGAVPQAIKWKRELREPTLRLYEALSEPHWDAAVLVWPETAIPAFPHDVPETLAALGERAAATDTDLLIGMPTGEPWNGTYFNSVVDLGRSPGRYDKRHLVPFGEFFPLPGFLRDLSRLLSIPMSDFSRGAGAAVTLEVAGYRAGLSICYEDAFPREVNDALPGAAFLVNVSNDAWFGDSVAPHQHLEIARMRALETGRYLLRATNTGISAVIDAQGRVRSRSPQFAEYALRDRVEPRRGATPFVRFGNSPVLGVTLVMLGVAVAVSRRDGTAARGRG